MAKTKTLWHYIIDWDFDTKEFKLYVYKQIFYLNQDDPNDEYYYYDKYFDDGIHKDTIGEITNEHYATYHLYSPKLTKNQLETKFWDYFNKLILDYKEEQTKRQHKISDLLKRKFKEKY